MLAIFEWVIGGRFVMALKIFLYKKQSSKQSILSYTAIDVMYKDVPLHFFSCLPMSSIANMFQKAGKNWDPEREVLPWNRKMDRKGTM